MSRDVIVRTVTDTNHYTWGEGCHAWILLATEHLAVIRESIPPGAGERLHRHEHATQLFVVHGGEATFEVDDATYIVRADESLRIGPEHAHKITNQAAEPLHFLVISTPPSHGDRIDLE